MTIEQLIEACAKLSVFMSFETKDGEHSLTNSVLELQVCLQEMGKRNAAKVNKILKDV